MLSEKVARCFITDDAGFIGSHLVDRLVKIGQVTVYDNLSSSSLEFIGHHLERDNFNFTRADLRDFNTLKQATARHDVVFHLAANPEVKAGTQTTDLDLKTRIIASYSVLGAMRLNQIKKVVFTSSSAVYGDVSVTLVSQDHGPLLPISLYGASKLGAEGLISAFCHGSICGAGSLDLLMLSAQGLPTVSFFNFINKLKQNRGRLEILGDGSQQSNKEYAGLSH